MRGGYYERKQPLVRYPDRGIPAGMMLLNILMGLLAVCLAVVGVWGFVRTFQEDERIPLLQGSVDDQENRLDALETVDYMRVEKTTQQSGGVPAGCCAPNTVTEWTNIAETVGVPGLTFDLNSGTFTCTIAGVFMLNAFIDYDPAGLPHSVVLSFDRTPAPVFVGYRQINVVFTDGTSAGGNLILNGMWRMDVGNTLSLGIVQNSNDTRTVNRSSFQVARLKNKVVA